MQCVPPSPLSILPSPPLWIPPLLGTLVPCWEQGRSGGGGGGGGTESGVKRQWKKGRWPAFFCSPQTCGSFLKNSSTICKIVAENSHATTAVDQNDSLIFKNKTRQDERCAVVFTLRARCRLYRYDVCAENRVCYWIHGTFLHYLCRHVRLIGAALHEPWNGGVHAVLSTGCALGQKSFKYSVH